MAKLSYLAVDDDPNTRQILTILLGQMMGSSQVVILEDSENFSGRLQSLPFVPSVIFLDIAVAPIDGFKMLEIIRGLSQYRETVVIALTARVMVEEIEHMKTVKFNGMIGKPIIRHIFPELVRRIVLGDDVWYIA
ncbi:MAG: response regulator [Chloroflexi bacterium]|nr:response regulator [Chloroflexota bacterium]